MINSSIEELFNSIENSSLYKKYKKMSDILSKDNNIPELAYETVRVELTMGSDIYNKCKCPITVAKRDEVSPVIKIA